MLGAAAKILPGMPAARIGVPVVESLLPGDVHTGRQQVSPRVPERGPGGVPALDFGLAQPQPPAVLDIPVSLFQKINSSLKRMKGTDMCL